MRIKTSRFGEVDVDDNRVISFPKGLLGFVDDKRYILLKAGEDSSFWWLQSVERADLALVVTDPALFVPGFEASLGQEQLQALDLASADQAQIFVIVNKRGSMLTANFQGPLVVSVAARRGEQLVLSNQRYSTRTPLLELESPVAAAAS